MDLPSLLRTPPARLGLIPGQPAASHVVGSDPALRVMTDFRLGPVSVTSAGNTIETALATMRDAGVRFLFVVDDVSRRLVGSITSYDIQGEKPIQFIQSTPGGRAWHDVVVGDVMEPIEQWRVLDLADLPTLTVDGVVALLRHAGRRHLVVVERPRGEGDPFVRGVFSASRVQQLLGTRIEIEVRATTFAEIERMIV